MNNPEDVWRLESIESPACNKDGFFPLELNVSSLATGAKRKLILAMSVRLLEEWLVDLTDLQLSQLEYVNNLSEPEPKKEATIVDFNLMHGEDWIRCCLCGELHTGPDYPDLYRDEKGNVWDNCKECPKNPEAA